MKKKYLINKIMLNSLWCNLNIKLINEPKLRQPYGPQHDLLNDVWDNIRIKLINIAT